MKHDVKKIHDHLFEIPAHGKMRVPARIYASEKMLDAVFSDDAPQQAANVAWLPGIINYSMAMPDIHWGYGFPIGGVAAFDYETGVVSPGGVGYDINCGVRLLKTDLQLDEVRPKMKQLVDQLFRDIPSGVGSTGPTKLTRADERAVLQDGAGWAVQRGYGDAADLNRIEENGAMSGADPDLISERALTRGKEQLGTLGSGNHFVEVGVVDEIYNPGVAAVLGLAKGQITVTIHTGSRGLGHQVCDDAIKVMLRAVEKYGIELPDRQLCCAPIQSPEGRAYLAQMAGAVNFAFANRQMITHWARGAFAHALGMTERAVNMQVVYEVAHNIAKIEEHIVNGQKRRVCVHRKGATRAFAPNHPAIPQAYRDIGQPVLIPGDMGRYSYVLVGTDRAMEETFGSTCHGAGRLMSRTKAKQAGRGRDLRAEMAQRGIVVRASSYATIAEEMPDAYKDVADVVDAVHGAGISKKVIKLRPLGVIKG
ncbi:RtcB family protein [candidate division KSB1 bacterium]|nr:RtcB family protein [candidate division KSB1 bacterium]RQW08117.1 MAG: RtcB family protein [candidate division KSB1 bacterium]